MFKRMQRVVASTAKPVLAAVDGKSKKYILANFICQNANCKTSYVTNNMATPLCVACSSPMKRVNAETLTMPAHSIVNDLPKIGKCNCGAEFHTTAELSNKLKNQKGYCLVCSDEISFDEAMNLDTSDVNTSEEDDEENEVDSGMDTSEFSYDEEPLNDEPLEDEGAALNFDDEDESSEGDDESEDEEVEASSDTSVNTSSENDEDSVSDEELDKLVNNAIESAAKEIAEEKTPSTGGPTADKSAPVIESKDPKADNTETKPVIAKAKKIKINTLASFIKNQAKVKDIELTMSSGTNPKWWLFADARPVAFSTKDKASDNVKGFFSTPQYANAFRLAASEGVTNEIVEDFGFEPVATEMPVDEATDQKIEEKVNEATEDLNKKLEETAAFFEKCLGIAAVGSLKGIVQVENPLQQAIVAELNRLGDTNSVITAQKIFKDHGESYIRNLVTTAKELTNKNTTALAELSQVVASADYRETVALKKTNIRQAPVMVPAEMNDVVASTYSEPNDKNVDIRSLVRSVQQRRYGF